MRDFVIWTLHHVAIFMHLYSVVIFGHTQLYKRVKVTQTNQLCSVSGYCGVAGSLVWLVLWPTPQKGMLSELLALYLSGLSLFAYRY